MQKGFYYVLNSRIHAIRNENLALKIGSIDLKILHMICCWRKKQLLFVQKHSLRNIFPFHHQRINNSMLILA